MLPKERERFITALSGMIASRLLNIEVISAELGKLDLAGEVTALAQREYAKYTNDEAMLRTITRHLGERLEGRWLELSTQIDEKVGVGG